MKVGRIVGIALLALLVLYVFLLHAANPDLVVLPWLSAIIPPLPVSFVVVLALLLGFLIGWVPTRLLAWRRGREAAALKRRLDKLDPDPAAPVSVAATRPREIPVIPDRGELPFDQQENDQYGGPYDEAEGG